MDDNKIVKFPEITAYSAGEYDELGNRVEEFSITINNDPGSNTVVNCAAAGFLLGWIGASIAGPENIAEALDFIKQYDFAHSYRNFARIIQEDPGLERFAMFRVAPGLVVGAIPGAVLGGIAGLSKKIYTSVREKRSNKRMEEAFRTQNQEEVARNTYIS